VHFRVTFPLFAAVALLALVSARAGTIAEIPFQYRDGFLWLKVSAACQSEPLNFLLDSGAASSVLNVEAAQRLHLKLGSRQSVQGVQSQATAYRVNRFKAQAAGITLPESVLALDLRAISATCHQPIDGLLGTDFFRGRIVQIDFAASKIRFLDQAQPSARCVVLPIKMRNNAICVPVDIAGNSKQWMRLDTGCDSALEWTVGQAKARSTHSTSVGLASTGSRTIYADVQLGGRSLSGVKTGIHDQQIFPGESGLLGNALLCGFRVTVDAPGHRLILE
jgi:predicted aspartyl protease